MDSWFPCKPSALDRRAFLVSGALAATVAKASLASQSAPQLADAAGQRRVDAYGIRIGAADRLQKTSWPLPVQNGDEARYPDKRASFSKTLPHNDIGEVEPAAYAAFVETMRGGTSDAFARLPRAPGALVRLNDPQAAFAFGFAGADSAAIPLGPPPPFASAEMAAETAELYWQALLVDTPFRRYEVDPTVAAACHDLMAFSSARTGSRTPAVTPETLFRGDASGDLVGPYFSQFLWRDIPFGNKVIDQRYSFPSRDQHFLTDHDHWLACQRGANPDTSIRYDGVPRYICSNREFVEFVHRDFSFQPYMNAALIMLRLAAQYGDDVLSPTNPYRGSRTQFGDITFGGKDMLTLVAEASLAAQKAAYFQKWLVHRRLRPEVFGGRIEMHVAGLKRYDIHPDLLDCDGLQRSAARVGSRLLPIAYPEGCPTHPSYPSAHAYNAGACAAVLKAFFNQDFPLPEPLQATDDGSALEPWRGAPLTLGHEIDKLASNIAIGRQAAGVHYRSDSLNGLAAGEAVGIALLVDHSVLYREQFDGFVLSLRDGRKVTIRQGSVL